MKRLLISAAALAVGLAGTGLASADPQFNGKNDYGLCKAFANHTDGKGNDDKNAPRPTGPDGEPFEDDGAIADYCAEVMGNGPAPGNSDGRGKPN